MADMKGYDMKKISIAILLSGIIYLFLTGCGSQSIDPADGAQDSWTNDSAADSSEDSSSETSTLPYDDSICGLGGTELAWDGAQPDMSKYSVMWRKTKDGSHYLPFVEGVGPTRFEHGVYECFQQSPVGAMVFAYYSTVYLYLHDILKNDYTVDEYTNLYQTYFNYYYSKSYVKEYDKDYIADQAKLLYNFLETVPNSEVVVGPIGFSVIGYTGYTATIGILWASTDPTIYNLQIRNSDLVKSVTYTLTWENNAWRAEADGKEADGYKFRYYEFWVPKIT
jgi:hypothetical protein